MPGISIPAIEEMLTAPGFAVDPYPAYADLRELAPVYWSDAYNAWVVSRHSDVSAILRDWKRFSNTDRVTRLLAALPESDRPRFSPLEEHFATGMVHPIRQTTPDYGGLSGMRSPTVRFSSSDPALLRSWMTSWPRPSQRTASI